MRFRELRQEPAVYSRVTAGTSIRPLPFELPPPHPLGRRRALGQAPCVT